MASARAEVVIMVTLISETNIRIWIAIKRRSRILIRAELTLGVILLVVGAGILAYSSLPPYQGFGIVLVGLGLLIVTLGARQFPTTLCPRCKTRLVWNGGKGLKKVRLYFTTYGNRTLVCPKCGYKTKDYTTGIPL